MDALLHVGLAALGSVTFGITAITAWLLSRQERLGRELGVLLAVLSAIALPQAGVAALGGICAWGLGRGAAAGFRRGGGSEWVLVLLGVGLAGAALAGRPAPAHGAGIETLVEQWLRSPATPLCLLAGLATESLGAGMRRQAVGLLVVIGAAIAWTGRPWTEPAVTVLGLLIGAATALRWPANRVAPGLLLAQLAAAFIGLGPATDPYAHPPELPRSGVARLDVRIADGAMISGLAIGPDGRVFFGELASGTIRTLSPDSRAKSEPFVRVPIPRIRGSRRSYELGLWGLAIDPTGTWLYAMAVHRWDETIPDPEARTSRIVRVNLGDPSRVVHDVLTDIPAGPIHAGGVLTFGPDGALYASVGDGLRYGPQGELSGNQPPGPGSLSGSILRIHGDGSIPADNPSPGSPVWAWGFRNVYGLAFDVTGQLWATENGSDCCDRLLLVERGGHHGWPPNVAVSTVQPLWDSGRHRLGPTGVVALPVTGATDSVELLFATWHTGAVHRLRVRAGALERHEILLDVPSVRPDPAASYVFAGAFTALARAPDGAVWFASVNAVGRVLGLDE